MTEAVLQASDMFASPSRWDQHFRRVATSMTLSVVYGHPTLESEQDHIIEAIDDFADRLLRAVTPGAHMVQIFPWLRHVPNR
jgi:hypothetical protein